MNKTIILAAAIIAFGIVVGAYVIGISDRYAIISFPAGENNTFGAYRLDKRTGKAWVIIGFGKVQFLVNPGQNMTFEEYSAAEDAQAAKVEK